MLCSCSRIKQTTRVGYNLRLIILTVSTMLVFEIWPHLICYVSCGICMDKFPDVRDDPTTGENNSFRAM